MRAVLDGPGSVYGVKLRTKRRVVRLVVVGTAAVLVGGAVHHFSGSTRSVTTTSQRPEIVGEQNGGIAYGDTKSMVLTTLGDPTRKDAACWIYTLHRHAINGMNLGKIIDAIKYCFANGSAGGTVVSTIHVHLIPSVVAKLPKDKRPPGGWTTPFTFMPKSQQRLS